MTTADMVLALAVSFLAVGFSMLLMLLVDQGSHIRALHKELSDLWTFSRAESEARMLPEGQLPPEREGKAA